MNPTLFSQISDLLNQLSAAPAFSLSNVSDSLNSSFSNIDNPDIKGSKHHPDLLKQLVRNSHAFTQLLEAMDDTNDSKERRLTLLRDHLHLLNIESLMHSTQVPQKLARLLFTSTQPIFDINTEYADQLKSMRDSLSSALYQPINELIDAVINWHQSGHNLLKELDKISDIATAQWMESAPEREPMSDMIQRWGAIYDQCYAEHFEQTGMQLTQSSWLNHWATMKLAWKHVLNEYAGLLGMPSPLQIETLVQRFDEQRRRIRSLERRLSELES